VKTTIELPDGLLRRLKVHAAEQGRSLKDLFTEAIETQLSASPPPPSPPVATAEGLEDDDPFFEALEQVRIWGNSQMPGAR
jgi:plasmid stability protein